MLQMLESGLENRFRNLVKSSGGIALKIICLGINGIPDRLVLRAGQAWFVELKRPGGKGVISPIQKWCHNHLQLFGFKVHIIDSEESLKKFINEICSVQLPKV